MKKHSIILMIGVFVSCAQVDHAQAHTDVQFSYVDGKIDVASAPDSMNFVFESFFPTFGLEQQFATLPGFASEAINGLGIGANDEIFYDVLDDLLYWDGTSVTTPPEDHFIEVTNTPPNSPRTIIDEDSGEQLGGENPLRNRVGAAGPTGDFHIDLSWRLEPRPSPPANFGAYGVKLRLTTTAAGIADSDPLIFAFNFGLNNTDFGEAVDAFAELLAPGLDGDFDADGDVDGDDFLTWQRGSPPDPPSSSDLSDWQANYGMTDQPLQQLVATVPEPKTALLCLLGMALLVSSKLGQRTCPDK